MPINELHVCSKIASESDQTCLLEKFRNVWISLDLPFFLASGYHGPGFHFMCHVAFSADSLTRACGNRALLSIYTALSLHKDVFSCLRNEHGDPGFLNLPVFAFAQTGIIFLEVTKGAGAHCSRHVQGTARCWCYDNGALTSVRFDFPPCLLWL